MNKGLRHDLPPNPGLQAFATGCVHPSLTAAGLPPVIPTAGVL